MTTMLVLAAPTTAATLDRSLAVVHAALVLHSLGHGGTERQVVWMTRGLIARGHRVTVLEIREGGHFRADVLAAGGEVVSAAVRTRADVIGVVRRLRALRADVVYGLNSEANVLALMGGAPAVFGVRGTRLDLSPKDALARVAMRLQHRLAGRARLVVANSEAAAAELGARGYRAQRLRVVFNGLDAASFARDPKRRAEWRARLGIGDDEQLIGTAARMDRQKDAATFLRAAARAQQPGRRFAWFGDGPLRAEIAQLARSLDVDLLLPGAVSDMPAVYSVLDVFTLSSAWGEGFSNAFAEALAAGLPCVVTNSGDHQRAREVATVVAPGDPDGLATGWDRAVAAGGPGWVRAHMDVDQMVSRTEAVLLEARGR
jgi:glycosyltransferase involved in cell wall biosynthesis